MNSIERRELERFEHWPSQTLRSRDFNDMLADDCQRRWWHNRALHQSYGVIWGLTVSRAVGDGIQFFRVAPGLAYDCFGRELYVQDSIMVQAPPKPGNSYTLVVRYRSELTSAGEACQPHQSARRIESPELIWKPARWVELTDGVPLATLEDDKLVIDPPVARPLARPHLVSGTTIPGKTNWRIWKLDLSSLLGEAGIEVTVDTSAAGFTKVPCYFAWLLTGSLKPTPFFPFLYDRIVDARPDRFTYSLIDLSPGHSPQVADIASYFQALIDARAEDSTELLQLARREQFYVCWLGIQMKTAHGPEPSRTFARVEL